MHVLFMQKGFDRREGGIILGNLPFQKGMASSLKTARLETHEQYEQLTDHIREGLEENPEGVRLITRVVLKLIMKV